MNETFICIKCGRESVRLSKEGNLCIDCWREKRKKKRLAKDKALLDNAFVYRREFDVSLAEARVLVELFGLFRKGL